LVLFCGPFRNPRISASALSHALVGRRGVHQLGPNTDQVLLAVSPFAPLTTVYIPYTLKVALD
jgi:hypothetical protein